MSAQVLTDREPAPLAERADTTLPEFVIEPQRGWNPINWAEIWRFRELLYFLAVRDITIRYKQTLLGSAWAIIQPLTTMVIFSLFFGKLAGLENRTGGVPYPIYVYAGLLAWTLFSSSITNSSNSLVGNSNLISKVYFPRLIIPFTSVGVCLVDFFVSSLLLIALMLYFHVTPTVSLVWIPLFLCGTILTAAGVGTLLSALTVSYRDFRYVIPFLVQIWMFVSPVIYPVNIVPARYRWLLALNPMTGLIDGFRSAFLGQPLAWPHILLSLTMGLLVFFLGASYFRSVERRFADVI